MVSLLNISFRAAMLCLLAAGGTGQCQPVMREQQLTTPAGLTLYVSANDVVGSGKSSCYAPCSNLHPPYLVEEGSQATGEVSIIERSDGARQWAHRGRPLYLWIYDQKPGDAGADGMNRGVWQIAKL